MAKEECTENKSARDVTNYRIMKIKDWDTACRSKLQRVLYEMHKQIWRKRTDEGLYNDYRNK
jgi:hypothetical protein